MGPRESELLRRYGRGVSPPTAPYATGGYRQNVLAPPIFVRKSAASVAADAGNLLSRDLGRFRAQPPHGRDPMAYYLSAAGLLRRDMRDADYYEAGLYEA